MLTRWRVPKLLTDRGGVAAAGVRVVEEFDVKVAVVLPLESERAVEPMLTEPGVLSIEAAWKALETVGRRY